MQYQTTISNLMSSPSALFAAAVAILSTGCIYTGDVDDYLDTIAASELGITSIEIESPNTIMALDFTEQFTAIGVVDYGDSETDLTDEVTWSISSSSLGSISDAGLLTSNTDTGVLTVTAKYAEMSATKSITMSDAALQSLTITGADSVDACTYDTEYTATGSYGAGDDRNINANVTWSTDTPSVAVIGSDGILITYGVDDGDVDVEVALSGVSASKTVTLVDALTSIAITPYASDEVRVQVYLTIDEQFTATGAYDDGDIDITETVDWSSSDPGEADFSDDSGDYGLLVPAAVGTTTITASCDGYHADTQNVQVNEEPTVDSIYIDGGSNITVDLEDGEEQLQAYAVFDNGDETEITDSDDIFWLITETYSGSTATVDNDDDPGLVSFSAVGQMEVEVTYTYDNVDYTDTIVFEVE